MGGEMLQNDDTLLQSFMTGYCTAANNFTLWSWPVGVRLCFSGINPIIRLLSLLSDVILADDEY